MELGVSAPVDHEHAPGGLDFEDSAAEGVDVFFDESELSLDDDDENGSSVPALDDAAFAAEVPAAFIRAEPPDLVGDMPPVRPLEGHRGATFDAVEDGFDLAAELNEAIDGQSIGAATSGYGDSRTDDGFSEVFREFKKGVSASLKEGDFETHYDLGIAYREMELHDDAIAEFLIASRSEVRRIDCLHMMGLCTLDVGRAPEAVDHFSAALNSGPVTRDQQLALRFELGRAYRASGDVAQARDAFEAVSAIDPLFCNVESLLVALDDDEKPEADASEVDSGYESFDDFIAEMSGDDPFNDSTGAGSGAASEMESFSDLVSEEEEGGGVESAPDSVLKRRKKISFL